MAKDPVGQRASGKPGLQLLLQLLGVSLASFFVPLLSPLLISGTLGTDLPQTWNSQIASFLAAIAALFGFRRVTLYPGARAFAYVLPTFSTTFGLATAVLLATRIPYSGTMLLAGYVASLGITFLIAFVTQRRAAPTRMYYVPTGNTGIIADSPQIEWVELRVPELPADPDAAVVADLRFDHDPAWERMLARAAISGRAVYHTKQLRESLTGRVDIEHLSENSFGSLLPNLAYRGVKRTMDLLACVLAVPVLFVPMLGVALLIRLDSPGPVFFRQRRMGYQGHPFDMIKFRTMEHRDCDEELHAAITQADDVRVTRVGRFLRRTRIDELPQLVNILRGEMSWVGPRPEALPLSEWYERELPFYAYRHIVRPGITGWAQVNQGHVAELGDVHIKLHYDFYYIKYFSAWLDALIALRTVAIILTGYGAK
ncbi:sugar transferase [Sphingomonas sp.]|jgi:lipopolysaccharide/colanic/teichoic acid biosynthesis glycosyltransferase|uniref:sugar transferase n=1 Tax=Sphingomonas sp. TaxID=28214 RepID=UPI002D80C9A4|nr:sugar transferase [Sphingomonas sp.]HEU0044515.1 sugar transferase [Sphingomonas sp.]